MRDSLGWMRLPPAGISTFNDAGSIAAQKKGSGIETGTLT